MMRILIFIAAMIIATNAYATCWITPTKIVECDRQVKDVEYEPHDPLYSRVLLCEATKEKMGLSLGPEIKVVHRDADDLFVEAMGNDGDVVARGTYNIDKKELIGWVPVSEE